jgi:hypothetical protein
VNLSGLALPNLEILKLSGLNLNGNCLNDLDDTKLRHLTLRDCSINNNDEFFRKFCNLQYLCLENVSVSLNHLPSNLKALILVGNINNNINLRNLSHLVVLDLIWAFYELDENDTRTRIFVAQEVDKLENLLVLKLPIKDRSDLDKISCLSNLEVLEIRGDGNTTINVLKKGTF